MRPAAVPHRSFAAIDVTEVARPRYDNGLATKLYSTLLSIDVWSSHFNLPRLFQITIRAMEFSPVEPERLRRTKKEQIKSNIASGALPTQPLASAKPLGSRQIIALELPDAAACATRRAPLRNRRAVAVSAQDRNNPKRTRSGRNDYIALPRRPVPARHRIRALARLEAGGTSPRP